MYEYEYTYSVLVLTTYHTTAVDLYVDAFRFFVFCSLVLLVPCENSSFVGRASTGRHTDTLPRTYNTNNS